MDSSCMLPIAVPFFLNKGIATYSLFFIAPNFLGLGYFFKALLSIHLGELMYNIKIHGEITVLHCTFMFPPMASLQDTTGFNCNVLPLFYPLKIGNKYDV